MVGNGAAGRLGQLVGAAHNEVFKGVIVLAESVAGDVGNVHNALGNALSLLLLLFTVNNHFQRKTHQFGQKRGELIPKAVDDDFLLKIAWHL